MSDSGLCVLRTLACVRLWDADFDEGIWKHRELRVNRLGGRVNMKEMLSHFKSGARKRKNAFRVYFKSRIFSKGHAVVITTRWRKESVTAWRRLEEASTRMRQEFWFSKVFPTWKQRREGGQNHRNRKQSEELACTPKAGAILKVVGLRLWDIIFQSHLRNCLQDAPLRESLKKKAKKVVRCRREPLQPWCTRAAGELAWAWIIKRKNMAQTSANLIAKKVSRFHSTFKTFPIALNHIHYSFLAPSLCEHYTVWILTLVCISAQV